MITFKRLLEAIKKNKNIKLKPLRGKRLDSPDEPIPTPGTQPEVTSGLGMIYPDNFRGR